MVESVGRFTRKDTFMATQHMESKQGPALAGIF